MYSSRFNRDCTNQPRLHKFFSLYQPTNQPPTNPQEGPQQIIYPAIAYPIANELLKLKMEDYNLKVKIARSVAQAQGIPVNGKEEYQTIGAPHFNLLQQLIVIAQQQMDYDNKNDSIRAAGLQRTTLGADYRIWCSNPQLMERLGVQSASTIWRRLNRLIYVGAVKEKIFHGTKCQYEVILNAEWLLIHDLNDPNFRPKVPFANKLISTGWYQGLNAKRKHIDSLKEPLENSLIDSQRNFSSKNNFDATKAEKNPLKRAPERSDILTTPAQNSGHLKSQIKNFVDEKKGKVGPADFDYNLSHYAFSQVYLFMQAALKLLWHDREIFHGARCKAEDYLHRNYFTDCKTEIDIDARIDLMHTIIKFDAEYQAKDPNRRFTLLPDQYFDKQRKPLHDTDYSGFKGTHRLLKNIEENTTSHDIDFEMDFRVNAALTTLRRFIRYYEKDPSNRKKAALEQRIRKEVPLVLPDLKQYFLTGVMP